MKIKYLYYDDSGNTLIEKHLDARICWGEDPTTIEIPLTEIGVYPQEAIYIDYKQLLKYMKRGRK